MKIFEFGNYREFIQVRIKTLPKSGRGELLRIARHLGIHSTTLSQILAGSRELTMEQAVRVADYFGLTSLETRYLFLLVQHSRAGTDKLRILLEEQLDELKIKGSELAHVVSSDKNLKAEEKATFYSNWFYSAVRILSSIPGFESRDAIAVRLGLPKRLVNEVANFLLRTGLCVETASGLAPGAQYTHLERDSPFISRHHGNWRIKAMEKHPTLSSSELAYSSPMSISAQDVTNIRKILVEVVERINAIRTPSDCEKAYCLNLDWFEF